MAKRNIIVLGASAGGIEACCEVLGYLPPDLDASLFIVQHVGPNSVLDRVLNRCGPFQVTFPKDGEVVRSRRAYVAPGDHHMLLNDGHIKLSRGPRENGHRPSVDVLFRSASRSYRSRVIAVVLSGTLGDGAAGVFAVKERGGVVVVQDPKTALFPCMPQRAMKTVPPDYCVPLPEIAALLVKLVNEQQATPNGRSHTKSALKRKQPNAMAAPFVCPECSGPLFQDAEGSPGQLKCLVGHSFSPESLSEIHREALERALVTTMRLLTERAAIHKRLANRKGEGAGRFEESATDAARDVVLLREILQRV